MDYKIVFKLDVRSTWDCALAVISSIQEAICNRWFSLCITSIRSSSWILYDTMADIWSQDMDVLGQLITTMIRCQS